MVGFCHMFCEKLWRNEGLGRAGAPTRRCPWWVYEGSMVGPWGFLWASHARTTDTDGLAARPYQCG